MLLISAELVSGFSLSVYSDAVSRLHQGEESGIKRAISEESELRSTSKMQKAALKTAKEVGDLPVQKGVVTTTIPLAESATHQRVSAMQKPILSRVVGQECAGQVKFGHRWQSEVYDLCAVLIDATDIVYAVGCVFRCELLGSSDVYSGGPRHAFVLMESEYIERVSIRKNTNFILALKFHTNLRSSQWFGGRGGWLKDSHCQLEELQPPHGFYVSGFYGAHSPGMWCTQLGCRFDLVSRSSRVDPIRTSPSQQQATTAPMILQEAHNDAKPFFYSHTDLQVVVIKCDDFVRALSIVTGQQYARYLRDRPSALGKNEHLLDLLPGERIRRVDVCHGDSALLGLRFVTTVRASQWFGCSREGTTETLTIPKSEVSQEHSDDSYVCGFFGTRDADGICSLGAVYQMEPPPRDVREDVERWEAIRCELEPPALSTPLKRALR